MLDAALRVVEGKGQLKYEQLKRMLLDQMEAGRLKPGDVLPPEVDLARQMGVARNTVRQAMRDLEMQRLIRRVRGRGTMVCDVPARLDKSAARVGQLLGLVLPELRAGMYQSLQAGFNAAMSAVGANMIVCDSEQDLHHQVDVLLQLAHRGVSGLALVPITTACTPIHHLAFLRQAQVPLVFCHRRVEGLPAPLIGFSSFDMGLLAGQELARFGHRRLAIIFSHASEICEPRKQGVRAALQKVGGLLPDEFVYYDHSYRSDSLPVGLEERLIEQLRTMFAHDDPPTGIVVSADRLAGVVCLALQKLGLSVPRDVSVIGFGDRENRNLILPCKLKSVTVDEWKLGQTAFETLAQIQRGERPFEDEESIMMPLEVSAGDSVGCPAARKFSPRQPRD